MPSIPASNTDIALPQPDKGDAQSSPGAASPDPAHAATVAQFNEAGVRNAQANWLDGMNALLYSPDTGYFNQRGAAAMGSIQPLQDAMGKLYQQAQDNLGNDTQRGIFAQATAPLLDAFQARIHQHAQDQGRVYDADASRARALSARDLAVNAWNPAPGADNSNYRQCAAILHNELENQFRHAWGEPAGDNKALWEHYLQHGPNGDDGMASLTTGVVNRLLANDQPHDARAFLDQVQHTLPDPTRDKLDQFVTAAMDQHAGIHAALQAQAASNGPAGNDSASNDPGSDLAAQQHKLDTLRDDGTISAQAHAIATHKIQADRAARLATQQQNDAQTLQKVWALKNANPNAALADLGSADYAYLKSRGLDTNALAILQSHPASDDPGLFNQLHRLSTQDPVTFGKENLLAHSGQLSKAHMEYLTGLQDAINKQDPQAMQAGKRIDMTVNALMGGTQPVSAEDGATGPGTDVHEKGHQAQTLESGLRDHLIAEQQNDPKLTLEDLHAAGAYFLKDRSFYGDGYDARTNAQQAQNGYLLSPDVLQKAPAGDAADRAQEGTEAPAVGNSEKQTQGQSADATAKPAHAPENYRLSGFDSHGTLPVDAPVATSTMDGQSKNADALPPKFAVGQHLPNGVIGEGSDPGSQVYTVKARGKAKAISLDTFCKETGYNYDQVMALNELTSIQARTIPNGTVLKLPTTSGAVPSPNHKPVVDVDKAATALDKNTAVDMNGDPKSDTSGVGYCSYYVFQAINAGRPEDNPIKGPHFAKDAGPILLKAGYTKVLTSSDQLGAYTPRKGDVVVMQDYPHQGYYVKDKDGQPVYVKNEDGSIKMDKNGNPERLWKDSPAGHIAMYDGEKWVSDFQQTGVHHIWAGTKYEANKVGMAIYRP